MRAVLVDHPRPHVAVVTLNRPDRLNALSIDLALELDRTLHEVGRENDTWVVVLTGAGRGFCSGLDLKDYGILPGIDGLSVGRIAQRSMRVYSQLVLTLRRIPQPVLAAINGAAYGGGMCLTLAADVRIAAASAEFNATGIVNGLTSTEMGAGWLLPRLIGASQANDLLLTGRKVTAGEARELGLVSRVVDDGEVLDEALDMAGAMCRFSPYGLAMTKSALWANLEVSSLETAIELEDRNQLMLGFTENLQEAIRAFGSGREPVYTDEPRRDLFDRSTAGSEAAPTAGPNGMPAEGANGVPAAGPDGVPATGPDGVPAEGPDGVPAGGPDGVPAGGPDGVPAEGADGVRAAGPNVVPAEGADGVPAEGADGVLAEGGGVAGPSGAARYGGAPGLAGAPGVAGGAEVERA